MTRSILTEPQGSRIGSKRRCGIINSSLWNAAVSSDLSPVVAIKLSEVFAWNIDFFGFRKEIISRLFMKRIM
jgi:hypothetical protein